MARPPQVIGDLDDVECFVESSEFKLQRGTLLRAATRPSQVDYDSSAKHIPQRFGRTPARKVGARSLTLALRRHLDARRSRQFR